MNAFKAVVMLCAVLGASTATQYASNGHRGWEAQSSPAGQGGDYAQKGVQQQQAAQPSWATGANNEAPASSASYGMFSSAPAAANIQASAMPAPGGNNGHHGAACATATTTVRQVCTCISLPAGPQIPANVMSSFGSSSVAAPAVQAAAPVGQHSTFAAPVAQTAHQNTYSAPQQLPQASSSVNTGKAY